MKQLHAYEENRVINGTCLIALQNNFKELNNICVVIYRRDSWLWCGLGISSRCDFALVQTVTVLRDEWWVDVSTEWRKRFGKVMIWNHWKCQVVLYLMLRKRGSQSITLIQSEMIPFETITMTKRQLDLWEVGLLPSKKYFCDILVIIITRYVFV